MAVADFNSKKHPLKNLIDVGGGVSLITRHSNGNMERVLGRAKLNGVS